MELSIYPRPSVMIYRSVAKPLVVAATAITQLGIAESWLKQEHERLGGEYRAQLESSYIISWRS